MNRSTTSRSTSSPRGRAAAKAEAEDARLVTGRPPVLDLQGLLGRLGDLKLPGVDVAGLLDSRRKDVDALLAANEQAWRGMEAVTRRQGEMLSAALDGLRRDLQATLDAEGASARLGSMAGHAQQALAHALANMKELAELSAQSQHQVLATLNQRLRDGVGEAAARLPRKS